MKPQANKPISDKKNQGKLVSIILSYVWVPIAFALPFVATHHMASQNYMEIPGRTRYTTQPAQWRIDEARSEALRSGCVGLFVAIAIYVLWRVDRMLGKDRPEIAGSWMSFVVGAFAVLLWTVWTCAGHLMIRANDEVNQIPAQLPGLEGPNE
ncbi:MAG: hypothetical protein K2X93_26990 [Candidatus Obscuribacterales bacterium]|nr:hypothetical protein [Candidatus Obscuribacterales bacterium]